MCTLAYADKWQMADMRHIQTNSNILLRAPGGPRAYLQQPPTHHAACQGAGGGLGFPVLPCKLLPCYCHATARCWCWCWSWVSPFSSVSPPRSRPMTNRQTQNCQWCGGNLGGLETPNIIIVIRIRIRIRTRKLIIKTTNVSKIQIKSRSITTLSKPGMSHKCQRKAAAITFATLLTAPARCPPQPPQPHNLKTCMPPPPPP